MRGRPDLPDGRQTGANHFQRYGRSAGIARSSQSRTGPSPRSPTPTDTAHPFSSAPTARARPRPSSPTYVPCENAGPTRPSPSDTPSQTRSAPSSALCLHPRSACIRALPDRVWRPALEQDGSLRVGAEVAERTGLVDLAGHPGGTRIVMRREQPYPGVQLSLFDQTRACATRHSSPTRPSPQAARSSIWRPSSGPTAGSRTTSAAARPPASAASPPATSPSTRPGWSCP